MKMEFEDGIVKMVMKDEEYRHMGDVLRMAMCDFSSLDQTIGKDITYETVEKLYEDWFSAAREAGWFLNKVSRVGGR